MMEFPEFCEKILGVKLTAWHKRLYESMEKKEGKLTIVHLTRRAGMDNYRKWLKNFEEFKKSQ